MKEQPHRLSPQEVKNRHTLDLHVLSPVHIGTREGRLKELEFVYSNGQIHIIDENLLGRFLKAQGLIDAFVEAARSSHVKMGLFLQKYAQKQFQQALSGLSCFVVKGGDPKMNEFRSFTRDGNGQIYIPGTSIKGVLRTALLYGILKADEQQRNRIEERIHAGLPALEGREKDGRKKSFSNEWLNKDLLQSFSLPSAEPGPNEDLLRCLTVRDAYPIGSVQNRIIKIQFLSRSSEGNHYWNSTRTGRPLEIWLEAVVEGTFRMEVLWDPILFQTFREKNPDTQWPINGFTDLLALAQEMTAHLREHENGFFSLNQSGAPPKTPAESIKAARSLQSWYASQKNEMLRIGFGSGMLSTTIGLMVSEDVRKEIRNICGHPRGNDPAPKSRRIWNVSEDQWRPMGWMQIRAAGKAVPKQTESGKSVQDPPLPHTPFVPQKPKVRPIAFDSEKKVTSQSLMNRATTVQLNDRMNLERIVNDLDELEEKEAAEIAEVLRDRMTKASVWAKHPLKNDIEMFLT